MWYTRPGGLRLAGRTGRRGFHLDGTGIRAENGENHASPHQEIIIKKSTIGVGLLAVAALAWTFWPSSVKIRNARPASSVIVCFGDSLTHGTGAGEGMSYPEQLSRKIGRPVINAGVPGDTTESALKRLETDVLELKPGMVLITLGGNDLKNGVDRDMAFANFRKIVTRIQAAGALVVIGGVNVPLMGRGFGDVYEQLARDTGSVLIPNVLKGLMGNSGLMSDPIHPNTEGYTRMADIFHEAIRPYLR